MKVYKRQIACIDIASYLVPSMAYLLYLWWIGKKKSPKCYTDSSYIQRNTANQNKHEVVKDTNWSHSYTESVTVRILHHYTDVIMSAMASQITGVSVVYSTVCSGADQRKHQSSASLAIVREIHRSPVNSPHKGQVTRKMFPFDDVIMFWR